MKRKILAFCTALAAAMLLPVLPAAASDAPDRDAYAAEVVALVNAARADHGLAPVAQIPLLDTAAAVRAEEITQVFSHTRPDGRACQTALDDAGAAWRTCGENIAYGYPDPAAVMDGWMQSDGHRANILNASFDAMGVGVVWEGGTLYWTQVFTGGTSYAETPAPAPSPDAAAPAPDAPAVPETPAVPAAPTVGTPSCITDGCGLPFCLDGRAPGCLTALTGCSVPGCLPGNALCLTLPGCLSGLCGR